jgi:hypothetical protein
MATRDEILEARAIVPEGVVYRAFEAETLLLNLATGTYHGIDRTGARMLELLEEAGGGVRRAIERLAAETGTAAEDIEGDLADFCGELLDRGLLVLAP